MFSRKRELSKITVSIAKKGSRTGYPGVFLMLYSDMMLLIDDFLIRRE